jgi:hypothetical protein
MAEILAARASLPAHEISGTFEVVRAEARVRGLMWCHGSNSLGYHYAG